MRLLAPNWVQSRRRLNARVVAVICLINIVPKWGPHLFELSIYSQTATCALFSGIVGNLQSAAWTRVEIFKDLSRKRLQIAMLTDSNRSTCVYIEGDYEQEAQRFM